MATEQTFAMVKPDGVKRGLVGEVVSRLERKGFTILQLKLMQIPREMASDTTANTRENPFSKVW